MSQARRWCFTLNNPSLDERDKLVTVFEQAKYAVCGREKGSNCDTPHLQGFIIFAGAKRFNAVKKLLGNRCHLEAAKGTSSQASEYCKKDGDYEEWGNLPNEQGKRTDWEAFRDWILEQETKPSQRLVASTWPSIFGRYRSSAMAMVDVLGKSVKLVDGELRGWQRQLDDKLTGEPDDRSVMFYVDYSGNKGKSWFTRWYLSRHSDDCQRLSVGKRDDLAHAIDETKRVFFFDIPRQQLQFIQYPVLESLKDQLVFSPKYESKTKVLNSPVHVVVFCNEDPDLLAMSADRYDIHYLH